MAFKYLKNVLFRMYPFMHGCQRERANVLPVAIIPNSQKSTRGFLWFPLGHVTSQKLLSK